MKNEITIEISKEWHGAPYWEECSELDACLLAFYKHSEYAAAGWRLSKPDTFWRIASILWPRTETSKVVVEPNPWAERMIREACKHKLLAASGCASSGKSFLLGAAWAMVNWLCAPGETVVIITSTTIQASRQRVWKDVSQLFQAAMGIGLSSISSAYKLLDATAQVKLDAKVLKKMNPDGYSEAIAGMGIQIVAGEASMAADACKKIQGIKARRVFLIADEMPYLGHSIAETFISNLMSNREAQMIGLGNFASGYDAFGVFTEPVIGWKNLTQDMDGWETKPLGVPGYCMRFDGEKSENILQGREVYPGLYSVALHQTHLAMGRNSAAYWKFCRSMPMPEGDELSIYSEADLLNGDVHGSVVWDEMPDMGSFLDPAFTTGGDRSSLVIFKVGTSQGRQILQYVTEMELKSDVTDRTPHDFQIARQFRDKSLEYGVAPENAGFDSTGAGISFGSIVWQEWSPSVLAVQFGGAPSDHPVGVSDGETCYERYYNRVAELWVQGREYVRAGQFKGMSREMASELLARRFPDPKLTNKSEKKVRIESKKDMKKRIGFSPDLGDAGMGAWWVARERMSFHTKGFGDGVEERKESWSQWADRANGVETDDHLVGDSD